MLAGAERGSVKRPLMRKPSFAMLHQGKRRRLVTCGLSCGELLRRAARTGPTGRMCSKRSWTRWAALDCCDAVSDRSELRSATCMGIFDVCHESWDARLVHVNIGMRPVLEERITCNERLSKRPTEALHIILLG